MPRVNMLRALSLSAACWTALTATLFDHAPNHFDGYVAKFGRHYRKGSKEYELRRELFEHRILKVNAHNARPDRLWNAEAGIFADRTEEERAAFRGWRRTSGVAEHGGTPRSNFGAGVSLLEMEDFVEAPEVDWRFLTTSNQIIDQSACGSCWAATTASVLEAHFEIHHGRKNQLSVQEILACTPNPRECGGQGGCKGATVELGMEWILHNGVNDASTVPYEARDSKCPRDDGKALPSGVQLIGSDGKVKNGMGLVGWQTLPKNEENPLVKSLMEYGPVALSVGASTWFEYSGGIFDGCNKDVVIDHAVTLYGYGNDQGKNFWLIRNTWGPDWGEKGFIRMLRPEDSYCGMDNDNQQGVGCKDDPKIVPVCGMCGMYSDSVVPHFAGPKNLNHLSVPEWLRGGSSAIQLPHSEHARVDISADSAISLVRREGKGSA